MELDKIEEKEDRLSLASFISESQSKLRTKVIIEKEADKAWDQWIEDKEYLRKYASYMHKLATQHWTSQNNSSRVTWIYEKIKEYYAGGVMVNKIKKEERKVVFHEELMKKYNNSREIFNVMPAFDSESLIKVLDIGSCYNPFKEYNDLDVTAIDLCPACPTVKECDFLKVSIVENFNLPDKRKSLNDQQVSRKKVKCDSVEELIPKDATSNEDNDQACSNEGKDPIVLHSSDNIKINDNQESMLENINKPHTSKVFATEKITELFANSYDVLIFSMVISYIPTPQLRFICFQKAYKLLKPNGLLCIVTPDSRNLNQNVHIFKLWKVTLGNLGFQRINYDKMEHFHGMVFRKGLCKELWTLDAEKDLKILRQTSVRDKYRNIDYNLVKDHIFISQDFNLTEKPELDI